MRPRAWIGTTAGIVTIFVTLILLSLAGVAFGIWYNYNVATKVSSSQRYVQTCDLNYLLSQKANIQNQLDSIANLDNEIADPAYAASVGTLEASEVTDARAVFNILEQAQCSRAQIESDLGPDIAAFYQRWGTTRPAHYVPPVATP